MTGVMPPLEVPADGWTVDDLPDDLRCELVDGALLVTPPPALRHQRLAAALRQVLLPALPPHLEALTEVGVHVDGRNYRQPDLVVYDRSAVARDRVEAGDVVLVVEVVSASSTSTNQVAKPAHYAAAGIPHFWRLELDPLLLLVHRLAGDAYQVTGRHDDRVAVVEPLAVAFSLDALLA